MIKIIGIDPSLRNFGISKGLLDFDTGKITIESVELIQPTESDSATKKQVRKNSDDLRRARWLQKNLVRVCEGFDVAAIEMPVGSQSARAMASYGICLGVLSSCPIPFIEVTPAEVKLAGHGSKNATKDEMIDWATKKYPAVNWKTVTRAGKKTVTKDMEHCADATACIHAAVDSEQFKIIGSFLEAMKKSPKEFVVKN